MSKVSDEQMERYLSVEWTVAEESAMNLTGFAKLLANALEECTKTIKRAHEEGDLFVFSSALTGLIQVLGAVRPKVEQVESESYAHYVELLGTRAEMLRMAAAIAQFHASDEDEVGEATGFDDILRSVGGDEGIIH